MTLFIHATNIHSGGGAGLLTAILKELKKQGRDGVLLVDSRFPLTSDSLGNMKIIRVAPSLAARLKAEWRLSRMAGGDDQVFSVGNLPPLIQARAATTLFLQNRYLVDQVSTRNFSWRIRLRIAVERIWLRRRIEKVDRIIVQTPSMAKLVRRVFGKKAEVVPFTGYDDAEAGKQAVSGQSPPAAEYDFVYIATGEPHKNHVILFEAWEILAGESICPSLCVTLSPELYPGLVDLFDRVREKGGVVHNVGQVSREEVEKIYRRSRAMIFPSTLESFGLPLLEAKAAGLPILASELDFVRDVVEPAQTFDPSSGMSIARAVKRFLGIESRASDLCTAGDLLQKLARP